MPIQYINTGSSANAGNGDTLRTAFNKINSNFLILSTSTVSAGPTGPTGTAGPTGPAGIQATLTSVNSHIIPSVDLTYDLGSTSSQWRSLYVGTSTIYLGGTALSVSGGNLTLDGSPVSGGGGSGSTLVNGTYTVSLNTAGVIVLPNLQSIDSSDPTTLVVGTADAKLTLDNFNQAALLQAKKSFDRYFSQGIDANFSYTNEGGQGVITATVTDLYLRNLLEKLAIKFDGNLDFPYSYNNVRVVVNPDVENILTTVTNITYGVGFGEFSIAVDQLPDPDPFTFTDIKIQYDYLNTVGLDVDKDIFGISTDNDDIDIKSGRDIDLQAADDISITAGSIFELELTQSDGQANTNGLKIRVGNTLTTHIWAFRFDGVTELPGGGSINGADYDVEIAAGDDGSSTYGHVTLKTNGPNGVNEFYMNSLGELNLPKGGVIQETEVINELWGTTTTSLTLVPAGAANGTQRLEIYSTAGGEGNHIHITSGDQNQTDLFLGNDTQYFAVGAMGQIEVRARDGLDSPTTGTSAYAGSPVWIYAGNAGDNGGNTIDGASGGDVWLQAGTASNGLGGQILLQSANGPAGFGSIKLSTNGGSSYWEFDKDDTLTFPSGGGIVFDNSATSTITGVSEIVFANGTTSTGATVFANSSSYKIQTISFGGSPSNVVSTFEFGVASITIPGNGIIYNEGQVGHWALDGANEQFTFPNLSRISYGLGNAGLTVDDLKIQSVNTGNVVVSANGEDWVFSTNGSLAFPDSTVQTTAYRFVTPPVNSTSTGVAGSLAQDETYFYVCTATNAWQRIAWDNTPW